MIDKITNNLKAIKEIAETTQNLDLKQKILDLREQIQELREENLRLREVVSKQEDFNMFFALNVYFNKKANGEEDGPYCTCCWDKEKKAIRLHGCPGNPNVYQCPACKTCVDRDL